MLALLKWHDSSFYTFPENFSTRYWLPVILNERFRMDTLSLFSHFFILLSSIDLLFYKKKLVWNFLLSCHHNIQRLFFSQCFIHLSKASKKKEENILVGRREVQRGPIHFYAPVGECWEPPHNQATWLKIRVNTLEEFFRYRFTLKKYPRIIVWKKLVFTIGFRVVSVYRSLFNRRQQSCRLLISRESLLQFKF